MPPRPRIVLAGQVPPPTGGQNIMIARLLEDFRGCPEWDTLHLPFHFTPAFSQARRFSLHKILELARIAFRLLRLRLGGPLDWIIAPSGGPQTAPVVRDILLLPLLRLFARRLCVQFHAAGIADRLPALPPPLRLLLRTAYAGVDCSVVMTEFNRRDPLVLGIPKVTIIPCKIPDQPKAPDTPAPLNCRRLLCMGHLCPDKGVDILLTAFASLKKSHPDIVLELVGEPIPPWNWDTLRRTVAAYGWPGAVELPGVLHGKDKLAAFGRAGVFVFPTRAPYESFGLVTAEAMRAGLPIVATDWRGNRDVVAGSSGVAWCAPGDPEDLARALRLVLDPRTDRAAMGRANRAAFERHYLHDGRIDPRWREALGLKRPSSG